MYLLPVTVSLSILSSILTIAYAFSYTFSTRMVVHVVLLSIIAFLILHYLVERRLLRRFASEATQYACDQFEVALALASVIHTRVPRGNDPFFLLPILEPLGATPIAILQRGGCCSGLSRLYILALTALRVSAAQVTLYHASGAAQHALVEVSFGSQRLIVDPLYGFSYWTVKEAPISLEDLQKGEQPYFRPLPGSKADHYPRNTYYDFIFQHTKTANWTKSWMRRTAYHILRQVTGKRVDRLRLPPILEWPQIILAMIISIGMISLNLLLLIAE